jgi:GTP-binding protein
MTPIVAIVGRPNVGKSTLFNRLVGEPLAIVHDAPGVTRDRHYAPAHLRGRELVLVDTGGFDPASSDPMGRGIARHVGAAVAEADAVLCVLDATAPALDADREAVRLLRRSGKPVVWAANKVDAERREADAAELHRLGVAPLVPISALHGRRLNELEAALLAVLPPSVPEPEPEPDAPPRVALIGRPNAGKSSLFNRLVGTERSLVDARPGTTRDPIDVRVTWRDRACVLVDTAGIRRRARVGEGVEAESVMRAIRAATRSEVAVLLVDASEGIAEQDARLLGLCAEHGSAVVVGLNKLDLLDRSTRRRRLEEAADALRFARWAPIVGLSAKTGLGTDELLAKVIAAADQLRKRVSTGELNRFFERVLAHHPPPTHRGRAPRIYYVTQARSSPPTFVVMCSAAAFFKPSYRRYVSNQIRAAFGFEAVPLVVHFRERERR